jgi:hypothetical protein
MGERTLHLDANGDIWVVSEDEPSIMKQLFPDRATPTHFIGRLIGKNVAHIFDQSQVASMIPLVLIRACDLPPGIHAILLDP